MGIKYLFAVFLAAAFLMTGCSSKTDSTARNFEDTMENDGKKIENMLDGTTADETVGFDPTFGTGLNGEGRVKNVTSNDDMEYTEPNMTDANGGGVTQSSDLNNGMASSSSTGTNY